MIHLLTLAVGGVLVAADDLGVCDGVDNHLVDQEDSSVGGADEGYLIAAGDDVILEMVVPLLFRTLTLILEIILRITEGGHFVGEEGEDDLVVGHDVAIL